MVMLLTTLFGYNATASNYTANDNQIDEMFAKAPETVNPAFASLSANPLSAPAGSAKSAPVAIILDFFLGGLGIHRFYLGTELLTGLGYILTFGGIFGIVPLVDFIVLIINMDNISPYINNPKFFMWAN